MRNTYTHLKLCNLINIHFWKTEGRELYIIAHNNFYLICFVNKEKCLCSKSFLNRNINYAIYKKIKMTAFFCRSEYSSFRALTLEIPLSNPYVRSSCHGKEISKQSIEYRPLDFSSILKQECTLTRKNKQNLMYGSETWSVRVKDMHCMKWNMSFKNRLGSNDLGGRLNSNSV